MKPKNWTTADDNFTKKIFLRWNSFKHVKWKFEFGFWARTAHKANAYQFTASHEYIEMTYRIVVFHIQSQ